MLPQHQINNKLARDNTTN